jgi:hypothetical protein
LDIDQPKKKWEQNRQNPTVLNTLIQLPYLEATTHFQRRPLDKHHPADTLPHLFGPGQR